MMEELRIEPFKDDSGCWYWAVLVDGEIYADGEAVAYEGAREQGQRVWDERNRELDS